MLEFTRSRDEREAQLFEIAWSSICQTNEARRRKSKITSSIFFLPRSFTWRVFLRYLRMPWIIQCFIDIARYVKLRDVKLTTAVKCSLINQCRAIKDDSFIDKETSYWIHCHYLTISNCGFRPRCYGNALCNIVEPIMRRYCAIKY